MLYEQRPKHELSAHFVGVPPVPFYDPVYSTSVDLSMIHFNGLIQMYVLCWGVHLSMPNVYCKLNVF